MRYFVDVDIVGQPTNEEAVENLRIEQELHGVTVRLKKGGLYGPGGGNPEVRLSAHGLKGRRQLVEFLAEHFYDVEAHPILSDKEAQKRQSRRQARKRHKQ